MLMLPALAMMSLNSVLLLSIAASGIIAGCYTLANSGTTLKSIHFSALAMSLRTALGTAFAESLDKALETDTLLSALDTDPLPSPMGRIFAAAAFLRMFFSSHMSAQGSGRL